MFEGSGNPEGKGFDGRYSQRGVEWAVKTVAKQAGILKEVHTHMLRHTYATHTLVTLQRNRKLNGIEPVVFLQRQLGHSSIATTMDYLHLVNELADQAQIAYDDELTELSAELSE